MKVVLILAFLLAGCGIGAGLIPTKGGDNGGPVHCHGARCG